VPNLGFRFSTLAFDHMNTPIGEQSVMDEHSHAHPSWMSIAMLVLRVIVWSPHSSLRTGAFQPDSLPCTSTSFCTSKAQVIDFNISLI
jgi:hypothetical protein